MTISDQELKQQIEAMPDEMTPSRDLWPGIEKAMLYQEQTKPASFSVKHNPLLAIAASAFLVVASWVGVSNYQPQPQSMSIVAQMNHDFEQQKQLLLTSYGQQPLKQLHPKMQQELEQLKKARQSLERALQDDENNADLLNLLQWTQQQELEFIEQLYRPTWQSI